ncbi:MAG: glycosyltransferase [Sandaracinaceae bacterium]|nr:glycosyltransferase [Sandaracinaceae bacterium]
MRLGLSIPMYDEAALAAEVVAELVAALEGLDFRLALVDNGSRDGTGGPAGPRATTAGSASSSPPATRCRCAP